MANAPLLMPLFLFYEDLKANGIWVEEI